MIRSFFVGAIAATMIAAFSMGCASKASLKKELVAAIANMIELLESGDLDGFFALYIDPDKLQRQKHSADFVKWVSDFRRQIPRIVQELKMCQTIDPVIDEHRGTAIFLSPSLPAAGVRMHYKQGVWRLGD